ncbi:MAG: hypothetical protein HYZ28_14000 [Myxococcales bacterium]|nr:hypothetical protein [Myxococcales bacterium]
MISCLKLSLFAVAVLALWACGPVREWSAAEGSDEADLAQSESALVAVEAEDPDESVAAGDCTSLTPEQLAQRAADRVNRRFSPSGCASAVAQGSTVTYTLEGCSFRSGLVTLSGTFSVDFSKDAQGLHVQGSGSGLKVRRATVDVNLSGTCKLVNGIREWAISSAATGATARGEAIAHQGSYTLLVDRERRCAELDGAWSTSRGALSRSVTMKDLVKCAGQCPAAGGSIVVKQPSGVTLTVQFDGSSLASWSDSEGNAGTRELRCGI